MMKYDSYKDSGIEWIGEIPEHWAVRRLKYLAEANPSNIDKKSKDDEKAVLLCNYVDVYKNDSITNEMNFMPATASDSQIEKFSLNKGDVIATKDSESANDIGVAALVREDLQNVVCGYHLTHVKPREISGEYLFRQFQAEFVRSTFEVAANGVTRYALGVDDFKGLYVLVPPASEQTAIANYLDRKTAEIDQLIADKKRLLELYEEEKTATINEAVTKGLDPNVRMKDSGIEWLGEIPEHWEVKKIKYLLKRRRGSLKTGPFGSQLKTSDLVENGAYKVYTQRNVLDNDFESGEDAIDGEKFQSLKEFLIEPKDILFTSRGTIGKCNVFPVGSKKGILHPCLIRIQIDDKLLLEEWVLNYVNNTSYFIDNVKFESNSTIIDVIYGGTLKEVMLPIPPLGEQGSIVRHMRMECNRIESKTIKTQKLIELLTEYRTALISEVVTGKIKVV